MRRPGLLLLVACALSGCKTDADVCAGYGMQPGSQEFGQCMMQRQQMKMQVMQMYMNNQAQQQQNQNLLYQQQMRTIEQNNYYSRPTQTNCYQNGNFINCSSY